MRRIWRLLLYARPYALYSLASVALMAMVHWLTGWSGRDADWHGLFWPWAAATLAVSLAVPVLRPSLFDHFRSPRVLATAAVLPIILFIAKGVLA